MSTRLTRVEQVGRNRLHLLAAARRTFLARGYAGATVDAIAEEAGFTKGVVYSQFAGKSDLFLALLESRIDERAEENARLVTGRQDTDTLRRLLRANARQSQEGADWARLLIEFRLVASRDAELNARYAALHERTVDHFGVALADALAADGRRPLIPPRTLAHVVLALDSGAVLERATDPGALPIDLVETVVAALTTVSSPADPA